MAQFFGKYRAVVVNINDPMQLGRIQARVPDVLGVQAAGWAMPCVPVGLSKVRGSALPKIGATVWIEFEAGDPNRPIWTGCFFSSAADLPAGLKNKI